MAANSSKPTRRVSIKRGDAWDGDNFTITNGVFDFTGTTAKMQIRDKPDGTVYLTLNPSVSFPGLGQMTFSVNMTGAQSATLPVRNLVADVQIYRASALYGPYTVYTYLFDVEADITQ